MINLGLEGIIDTVKPQTSVPTANEELISLLQSNIDSLESDKKLSDSIHAIQTIELLKLSLVATEDMTKFKETYGASLEGMELTEKEKTLEQFSASQEMLGKDVMDLIKSAMDAAYKKIMAMHKDSEKTYKETMDVKKSLEGKTAEMAEVKFTGSGKDNVEKVLDFDAVVAFEAMSKAIADVDVKDSKATMQVAKLVKEITDVTDLAMATKDADLKALGYESIDDLNKTCDKYVVAYSKIKDINEMSMGVQTAITGMIESQPEDMDDVDYKTLLTSLYTHSNKAFTQYNAACMKLSKQLFGAYKAVSEQAK